MRTDYIKPEVFNLLLTALMPENRLALQLSLATGLRIGDCLSMRTAALEASQRPTIREQKTGKKRRIYVPKALRVELLKNAGKRYIFPGRLNPNKPRTRAAVYKDLKRVAALYRLDGRKIRRNVAPHTARKIYAVQDYHAHHSLQRVQRLLNHSNEAVTLLYAMADVLSRK
ncbi:tyrosine-type recombinase/integrase [Anaerotruncus colihominis]|uniref:tyrosine-type recombinase/integrase n=1 Tax=Anaerotruncus colihominis TaxID=169435 RepID=UPI0026F30FE7|nr:tyrosine-type recombinase/integrase [Anaerotruncus colihominis]